MIHDLISADRCYFMKSDPSRSSVIFIEPPRDMKGVRRKEEKEEKKGYVYAREDQKVCSSFGQGRSSSGKVFYSLYMLCL